MSTAPESARRASLAKLDAQLASGKDEAGVPLTAAARDKLAKASKQRKNELAELATLRVITPDLTFDGQLTIPLGKRRVELQNRGPANSPADVTIWLPDARVLFAGDILVHDPLPYPFGAWPLPWIQVLRDLEALPAAVVVPGHGPVFHDHSYTRRVRELMEGVTARVEELARKGRTLEQVQKEIDLEDLRRGYRDWNEGLDDPGDWKQIMSILVERAWKGVRGQG